MYDTAYAATAPVAALMTTDALMAALERLDVAPDHDPGYYHGEAFAGMLNAYADEVMAR